MTFIEIMVGIFALIGGSVVIGMMVVVIAMVVAGTWTWLLGHIGLHRGWYNLGYRHAIEGKGRLFKEEVDEE